MNSGSMTKARNCDILVEIHHMRRMDFKKSRA